MNGIVLSFKRRTITTSAQTATDQTHQRHYIMKNPNGFTINVTRFTCQNGINVSTVNTPTFKSEANDKTMHRIDEMTAQTGKMICQNGINV